MYFEDVQARFRFDVDRLVTASDAWTRGETAMADLRQHISARMRSLEVRIQDADQSEVERVQAYERTVQQLANIRRRATLQEVLFGKMPMLGIVGAMAVVRWMQSIRALEGPVDPRLLRVHVEAGRIAYKVMGSFGLVQREIPGVGQMTTSLILARVHGGAELSFFDDQCDEALHRARKFGVENEERVFEVVALSIRKTSSLLEQVALQLEEALAQLYVELDAA